MIDQERLTRQFLDFVRVDSPVFAEAAFANLLGEELAKLGLSWQNDRTGQDGAGNLLALLPGTAPGVPAILLCMHLDTVEPGRGIKPRIESGVIRSDGTTVLGADNKAAVASALEAIRRLRAEQPPHGDVEFLFTWGEERGHRGAKAFDYSRVRARVGFVPDGGGPLGTVITQAPYYESIHAVFQGRAAHAGISPEKGINAIVMAGQALSRVSLGRLDDETTANFGLIKGGAGRNTVPERVEMEGEVRSLDPAKLQAQVEKIKEAFESSAREAGGSALVAGKREYAGYRIRESDFPARIAVAASEAVGLPPVITSTCGGSDANELNAKGIAAVVLGMGGGGYHTFDEHISVSELVKCAEWIAALITESAKQFPPEIPVR
jgi:tripeptide aminopeptidase